MGKQWPMRLAGGVSVVFGIAFILGAAGGHPMLNMVVVYAATGGVDFVIEAWLLARRRRQFAGFGSLSSERTLTSLRSEPHAPRTRHGASPPMGANHAMSRPEHPRAGSSTGSARAVRVPTPR